ncbi:MULTISPECIES: hypothetical protein [unclassified Rhizobacter]|uniref:hypothetical protein n=1 Tax=unclassified Rhizobacter TaxID=2640088 RepID=UPI0006F3B17C|nr:MULTISPECIES: hypothetical protein [unclassified Rhizobacter]KQU66136.1 hypothetical protein ASC88_11275 [Rhizobacter sp. Root29]KQV97726.1 hypothetical protein ASC98_10370 [Rhizobacter sp. Root1238]KRB18890.1 hypothetical protein ASE08_06685 [Rhizobacter sp. Root16D2]
MSTTPRQQPHRLPVLTEVVPSARSAPPPVAEVVEPPPPRAPVAPAPMAPPAFAATAPSALSPLPPPPAPRAATHTAAPTAAPAAAPVAPPLSEEAIVQRVLTDVQRQLDLVFEYKLRELLTPALARIADSLIRDTRNELATTLREVVTRAVAQELHRNRGR